MPIETIEFNNVDYPLLQSRGFASQYAFAFAEKICKGVGVDVGYSKVEWKYPHAAYGIDNNKITSAGHEIPMSGINAYDLGEFPDEYDYLFSSHCLEHLPDYVGALDYWSTKIKTGGVLFIYLPNMDYQQYWQPENNRKHLHYISPKVMQSYFNNRKSMWSNVMVTQGYDINGSFYCIAERI